MKTQHTILFASKPLRRVLSAFAAFSVLMTSMPVYALDWSNATPGVGGITGGTAGGVTTINQADAAGIINWSDFDMAAGEIANFNQPSAAAVTLNRITASMDGTQIAGTINANGGVWVVDPNGVFIQNGASINVGAAFVAAAMDISDADFLAGNMNFDGTINGAGRVQVDSGANIAAGTLAALLGGEVSMNGAVTAPQAALAAAGGSIVIDEVGGGTITLTLAGDAADDLQLGGAFSGNAAAAVSGQDILQNTVGAVTVAGAADLTAAGGAITLDNAANDFQGGVTAHAGLALTLADTDGITLADVDTANGAITVTAGGLLTATDVAGLTDNDANDITLTGVGIAVGSVAAGAGAAADVTLDAGTGAITDLQADTVTPDAEGFSVPDGVRTVNIVADQLAMTADGNIGASGDPLDITVNTVAAESTAGGLHLLESDALQVGAVGDLTGITTDLGIQVETLNGNLTVDQGINLSVDGTLTGGDLLLAANGDGSDITLNANVYVDGGDATVLARDSVVQNATLDVGYPGAGSLSVTALDGSITMNPGSIGYSGWVPGDSITYTAGGDIVLESLDTHIGTITVSAGGTLTLNNNLNTEATPGALVRLEAGNGIVQNAGSVYTDELVFDAGAAVTLDGAGNLIGTVAGEAGGTVTLVNSQALDLGAVDGVSGLTTIGGNLNVTALNGDITDSAVITVGGNTVLSVSAANSILLDEANTFTGSVTLPAAFHSLTLHDTTSLQLGSLDLTGDLDLTTDGAMLSQSETWSVDGNVTLEATAGDIFVGWTQNHLNNLTAHADGNIQLVNQDDLVVHSAVSDNGDLIEISSWDGTLTTDGAVSAPDGSVMLTGVNGLFLGADVDALGDVWLTSDDVIQQTAGRIAGAGLALNADGMVTLEGANLLDAVAGTADGGLSLVNAQSLEIGTVDWVTELTSINGSLAVQAQGAGSDLTVSQAILAQNNVALTAGRNVGTTAKITAGGDVALLAQGGTITLDGAIDPATVTLTAAGDITVNAAVEADDLITVTAGTSGSGGVTVNAAGSLETLAAGGDIAVAAGATAGDITPDGAVTALDGVTLTASAGAISGAGLVTADTLTADAATGIDLNTTVATLDASVTGAGDIAINETDAINLLDVDTANGTITVTASGLITATDVATDGTVGEEISLTATADGIEVVSVDAGAADVTLDAAAAITKSGAGLVTAGTLTADAATGIDLNTTVATLDASVTGAGGITISETDAINLLDVDTANGAVTVTAGGQITATDVATGGTVGEDISLTAT
ncbi:MAG: filamentous hemagglutinin N-terminal domain-containing protein, partial [Kiritimatiellia bacterium]|nr:filamentous hemagglutinin N-terminal domain-containing protein [Kiritimatiellia bacterium]